MHSFQYLLLAALATTFVYATKFVGYTNNSCSSGAVTITDGDHSGRCSEIGFTPSVQAQAVDSGCTRMFSLPILNLSPADDLYPCSLRIHRLCL